LAALEEEPPAEQPVEAAPAREPSGLREDEVQDLLGTSPPPPPPPAPKAKAPPPPPPPAPPPAPKAKPKPTLAPREYDEDLAPAAPAAEAAPSVEDVLANLKDLDEEPAGAGPGDLMLTGVMSIPDVVSDDQIDSGDILGEQFRSPEDDR